MFSNLIYGAMLDNLDLSKEFYYLEISDILKWHIEAYVKDRNELYLTLTALYCLIFVGSVLNMNLLLCSRLRQKEEDNIVNNQSQFGGTYVDLRDGGT
ncbi:hypothetical protein J2T56_001909 [Natronobacillus azotifigens]|uniref:Uncharacterized protein n=1 Tax=Natronobacillus azotifigens TaxID=472978 RepID=A0A9J6RDK4_9BACI|nr:hypothetical protein [Natronobacillus azotifigens]MCZ0703752.1 hypothetical protein [Natronobacillus azotifigens]